MAEELGPLVERRRANEALAASQERFQAVTEAAMDAIVSADSSGRLLTWNGGAERTFGWTAAEIVGKPLTVIIPERSAASMRTASPGCGTPAPPSWPARWSSCRGCAATAASSDRAVGRILERARGHRLLGDAGRHHRAQADLRLDYGEVLGPSSTAGTGMGLAICRKIVEVLGAASASRATTGPTSASSCRRPWAPAGRATS